MLDPIYYNWIILAILFFIIELTSYTLLALWVGVASLLMAVISYFYPDSSLTTQSFIFALLLTISISSWYIPFKKRQKKAGNNKINNRAARYIGLTTIVHEISDQGYVKIKIEDTLWKAVCNTPLQQGDRVTVTQYESTTLIVKKAENQ